MVEERRGGGPWSAVGQTPDRVRVGGTDARRGLRAGSDELIPRRADRGAAWLQTAAPGHRGGPAQPDPSPCPLPTPGRSCTPAARQPCPGPASRAPSSPIRSSLQVQQSSVNLMHSAGGGARRAGLGAAGPREARAEPAQPGELPGAPPPPAPPPPPPPLGHRLRPGLGAAAWRARLRSGPAGAGRRAAARGRGVGNYPCAATPTKQSPAPYPPIIPPPRISPPNLCLESP